MSSAVLLINLGTPRSPAASDVGVYLKEFLMDPLVIDIPWVARAILVHCLIVPKRSHASGKLYETIWTDRGSPLLFHSEDLTSKMREKLKGERIELAMRYGSPSIRQALQRLKDAGVKRLLVVPLYPQYSLSATESSVDKVKKELEALHFAPELTFVPAFFNRAEYLDAVADVSRAGLNHFRWDKVLFSFHGLPERQVIKTDPSGSHCLKKSDCCERPVEANKMCYRFQCYQTAKELAKRLGIPESKYVVGFQSRLGRTPWIRPYSDELYASLAKEGVQRLAVLCPSFVADCLETLEEVSVRGQEQFKHAGGTELRLIPSLNSEPVWVDSLARMIRSYQPKI